MYLWQPYVPVAARRRQASEAMAQRAKKGLSVSPVTIEGRAIATTPWGKAWCANLECYSDYSNRLPRGRTYVRNGSVVDLQISPGRVEAHVQGSSMYRATVVVTPLAKPSWASMCGECSGGIDSLVELLQGRLATGVMERLCRRGEGLFPSPKEIKLACSCPDGAYMCKHLAAVLYGIGARLDHQPELLFLLRQVDASELMATTKTGLESLSGKAASKRTLSSDDVGSLFNLEMDTEATIPEAPVRRITAKAPSSPGLVGGGRAPKRGSSIAITPASRPGRTSAKPSLSDQVREALQTRGSLSNAEAQEVTGRAAAELRTILQALVAQGFARVAGRTRGARYHVCR
jgi:uncharacterized Zn finger protein